ncbi:MAG: hypothetical protein K1X75_11675 [Leptospirales bacterium]|nr:hypothetical protein [Leptospirales bacterium]
MDPTRNEANDELHITLYDGLYLRSGAIDADGRPTPARGRLISSLDAERIRNKILRCAHCQELARRLYALQPIAGAASRPADHSLTLNWKRLGAIAAALVFAPVIAATLALSQSAGMHAWRGLAPVSEGEQLASHFAGDRILMLTGLDKSGEINLNSGSRISLNRNTAEEVEWELHGGDAEVRLSAEQPQKRFFFKIGRVRATAIAASLQDGIGEAHFRLHCDTEAHARKRTIRITVFHGAVECCRGLPAAQAMAIGRGGSIEIVSDETTGQALLARAH